MRCRAARFGAVLAGLFAASTLAPPAASAAALPIGQCSTSANVILAVDFAHWGGPVVRACGSTPTTGFQLLNEGSFHTVGTQHDGPAFICRIGTTAFRANTEYPQPSEPGESCGPTPPSSGYWSYWHANAGQDTWSYAQLGATGYQPQPGSVDLWVYGSTNLAGTTGSGVPQFSPNTVRATNSAPPPSAPRASTSAPRGAAPSHSTGSVPRTTSSAGQPRTQTTTGRPRSSSTTSSAAAAATTGAGVRKATTHTSAAGSLAPAGDPTGVASTTGPAVIDAKPVAAPPAAPGSIWPVVIAVLVAALLAGGAGVTVLRRRSRS